MASDVMQKQMRMRNTLTVRAYIQRVAAHDRELDFKLRRLREERTLVEMENRRVRAELGHHAEPRRVARQTARDLGICSRYNLLRAAEANSMGMYLDEKKKKITYINPNAPTPGTIFAAGYLARKAARTDVVPKSASGWHHLDSIAGTIGHLKRGLTQSAPAAAIRHQTALTHATRNTATTANRAVTFVDNDATHDGHSAVIDVLKDVRVLIVCNKSRMALEVVHEDKRTPKPKIGVVHRSERAVTLPLGFNQDKSADDKL